MSVAPEQALIASAAPAFQKLNALPDMISAVQFAVGVLALTVGGWAIGKIGAQRAALGMCILICLFALGFGLARAHWGNGVLLTAYFLQGEFFATMASVAFRVTQYVVAPGRL